MSINVTISDTGNPATVSIRDTGGFINIDLHETGASVSLDISESRDAYQIAVSEGFTGSRDFWVESLTGESVSSVFGRIGTIISESGDYSDTGITNTSSVEGGTVKDALNTLDIRLGNSGALGGGGSVISVFGRAGEVIANSGDYSNTGITNESFVLGATTKDALENLSSYIENTGASLFSLSNSISGELGSLITNLSGDSLLKTDSGNFLNLEDSGNFLSKHDSGNIGGFSEINSGHLNEYSLKKTDSGNFLDLQDSGNINLKVEETGSSIFSLSNSISGELDFRITGLAEASLLKEDSGNFLQFYISNSGHLNEYVETASGHLDEYSLKKANSGQLLNLESSGHLVEQISAGGAWSEIPSGHLEEYSLQKTDSGNFLDLIDSGNLALNVENTGTSLFSLSNDISGELNFRLTGLQGDVLLKEDSGNFLQFYGANSGHLNEYVETASGHLDEYSLKKSNSGQLLNLESSGHIIEQIDGGTWGEIPSGHLEEYSLQKSDSGNFLDLADSGNIRKVNSVFGREGIIVGQSGDYADTGITNTSNVIGGTVKDSFNTLDSRLTASGALGGGGGGGSFPEGGLNLYMSGSSISSGIKASFKIPYDVELVDYVILADQEADLILDIRTGNYDSWAGFESLQSICNNTNPQLNSSIKNSSGEFSSTWNSGNLASGDIVGIWHESSTGLSSYDFSLNWIKI